MHLMEIYSAPVASCGFPSNPISYIFTALPAEVGSSEKFNKILTPLAFPFVGLVNFSS